MLFLQLHQIRKRGYGIFRNPFFLFGAIGNDALIGDAFRAVQCRHKAHLTPPPSPVTPASRCTPNVAHSRRGTIVAIRACAPRTRRRARVAQAANRDLAPDSAPTIYRAIPFENTIDAD
ncbi:hypothetical protein MK974_02090 [Burkholderia ambifaria]|uniref:hypothetical protein n=1 Tax=Burkholderia ambifaria TaxID=152480 RepID=UPI0022A9B67E|nr:hypothetical protein [Burkholderia ambifaria]WAS54591.1 hypothetical protein MK974_02090 [Burkholderia ambifaria]